MQANDMWYETFFVIEHATSTYRGRGLTSGEGTIHVVCRGRGLTFGEGTIHVVCRGRGLTSGEGTIHVVCRGR